MPTDSTPFPNDHEGPAAYSEVCDECFDAGFNEGALTNPGGICHRCGAENGSWDDDWDDDEAEAASLDVSAFDNEVRFDRSSDPPPDLAQALTDSAVAVAHLFAQLFAFAEPSPGGGGLEMTLEADEVAAVKAALQTWRDAGDAYLASLKGGA